MADFRSGWSGLRSLVRGPLRTLLTGQALGQGADGLAQVSFAQLVLFDIGSGASPGRIAGVLAATLLPFSLVGPFAGVFIDRWDRRRTLVVTSLCRAGLGISAIGITLTGSEWLAYVGVLLLLSSSRLVLDAKGAVLPRTVAADDLVRANAASGLLGMSAAFVGAVGGALVVSAGAATGFGLAALGYLAAAAAFVRLPYEGGGRREAGAPLPAALREVLRQLGHGARAVAVDPDLRRPLGAVWLHRALLGGGFVLLVLVADQRYHLRMSGYGLALAVTGVAAFTGTVLAPWVAGRWRSTALLPLAFVPPAAAAAVVGYGPNLAGLLAAVAVTAVSFQCLKVLVDALVGRAAPDALRGRVFALYDVGYNVAFVLAGLLMVPLWQAGHERQVLWWLAALFALSWLLLARAAGAWPFGAPSAGPARLTWRVRLGALAAGALPVLAFPQPALWWWAWVALVPWLLVVRAAATLRTAFARGYWAAAGFLIAMTYWLAPNLGPLLVVGAVLLGALWVPFSAAVWWTMRGPVTARRLLIAAAVLPSLWVLAEAVRSWSALGGPMGLLGASQWRLPALLAPASLSGVWLVSALIVAANVGIAGAARAAAARPRLAGVLVAASTMLAGPCWYLLESPPHGAGVVRVAMVQPGVIAGPARRLDREIELTEALPAGSADLVVWGESSVAYDLDQRPDVLARLQALSSRQRADLLVNVDARRADGRIEKVSVLIGPTGVLGQYQKMRLVPFGEYIPLRRALGWLSGFTRAAGSDRARGGHTVVLRTSAGLPVAPLICFEVTFPDLARQVARDGAAVLVYQSASSTFQGSWEPAQQASLAAVRAVESGLPAVQATLTGTTAAFTARGARLAWFDTHRRGVVTVALPLAARATPYRHVGDRVLGLAIVTVAVAVVGASLAAARIRAAPPAATPPLRPVSRHGAG